MIINYRDIVAELLSPKSTVLKGKSLPESNNQDFLNEKPMFQ